MILLRELMNDDPRNAQDCGQFGCSHRAPKMLDVIASAGCGPARILLNFYEFEIDIHETV
jgi:hypothetical protein